MPQMVLQEAPGLDTVNDSPNWIYPDPGASGSLGHLSHCLLQPGAVAKSLHHAKPLLECTQAWAVAASCVSNAASSRSDLGPHAGWAAALFGSARIH